MWSRRAPIASLVVSSLSLGCGGEEPGVAVCVDGDPQEERWGADCLCCHEELGVAGSVDRAGPEVARVVVLGADGRRAVMAPNAYGNFFRHVKLDPPLEIWVEGPGGTRRVMEGLAPHGSCNRCHGAQGGPALVAGPEE